MISIKLLMAHLRWIWQDWPRPPIPPPLPYEKSRNIGIIIHANDALSLLSSELWATLQKDKKNIHLISYSAKPTKTPYNALPMKNISKNMLQYNGLLHSPAIQQFLHVHYDMLMNAMDEKNILPEQIVARAYTRLRIGIYSPQRKKYYDLLLTPCTSTQENFNALIKYLKKV